MYGGNATSQTKHQNLLLVSWLNTGLGAIVSCNHDQVKISLYQLKSAMTGLEGTRWAFSCYSSFRSDTGPITAVLFRAAVWRRITRLPHKRLQIHLCVEMQRINGTPFMRQKGIPLPHRQPQVNVMDLCFCMLKINAAARRSRRLHSVSIAFPQRCWRLHSAHLGYLQFC